MSHEVVEEVEAYGPHADNLVVVEEARVHVKVGARDVEARVVKCRPSCLS